MADAPFPIAGPGQAMQWDPKTRTWVQPAPLAMPPMPGGQLPPTVGPGQPPPPMPLAPSQAPEMLPPPTVQPQPKPASTPTGSFPAAPAVPERLPMPAIVPPPQAPPLTFPPQIQQGTHGGDAETAFREHLARSLYGSKLGDITTPLAQRPPIQTGGGAQIPMPGGGTNFLMPIQDPDGSVRVVSVKNPLAQAAPMDLGALGKAGDPRSMMENMIREKLATLAGGGQATTQRFQEAQAQAMKGIQSPLEQQHQMQLETQGRDIASKETIAKLGAETELSKVDRENAARIAVAKLQGRSTAQQGLLQWELEQIKQGRVVSPRERERMNSLIQAGEEDYAEKRLSGFTHDQAIYGIQQGGIREPAKTGIPGAPTPVQTAVKTDQQIKEEKAAKVQRDYEEQLAASNGEHVRNAFAAATGGALDKSSGEIVTPGTWRHEDPWLGMGEDSSINRLVKFISGNETLKKNPALVSSVLTKIFDMPGAPTVQQFMDQLSRGAIRRVFERGWHGGPTTQAIGDTGVEVSLAGKKPQITFPGAGTTSYGFPGFPLAGGGLTNIMPGVTTQAARDQYLRELKDAYPLIFKDLLQNRNPTFPGQR
jgi:hypothetical protein